MSTNHFGPGKQQRLVQPDTNTVMGKAYARWQAELYGARAAAGVAECLPSQQHERAHVSVHGMASSTPAVSRAVVGAAAVATGANNTPAPRVAPRIVRVFNGFISEDRVPRSRTRWAMTPARYNAWMLLRLAYTRPLELACASIQQAEAHASDLRSGLSLMAAATTASVTTQGCVVLVTATDPIRLAAAIAAWRDALRAVHAICPNPTDPRHYSLLMRMTPVPSGARATPAEVLWAADFVAGLLQHPSGRRQEYTDERAAARHLEQTVRCLQRTGWYPRRIAVTQDPVHRFTTFRIIAADAAEQIDHERTAAAIMQASTGQVPRRG